MSKHIPDHYLTKELALKSKRNRKNTNSRYSFFRQVHFTAGDEQQFFKAKHHKPEKQIMAIKQPKLWSKYYNIQGDAVAHTFRYLFRKFKKGIYVKIQNGKLKTFLPFSNASFVNEWGDKIRYDPGLFPYIQKHEGRKYDPKKICQDTWRWYSNNGLVRYEYPIRENDSGVPIIHDMLVEVCKLDVPDMEFFINKRDFPLFKKDETEPYEKIWGENMKLKSHNYKTYSPTLSMTTTDNHADIPIPTWDDWCRVSKGMYFPSNCKDVYTNFPTPFKDKKSVCVFRGASTGLGVTIETNPRLKAVSMSKEGLLDAGITKWNLRPRKSHNNFIETIRVDKLPFKLASYLTPKQQSQYKYILHIPGHVCAYRLSIELIMGSVVLMVPSKYKLWYTDWLEEWVHYVPVKRDLSDIYDKIEWCQQNEDKCLEIIARAKSFYDKYLTKEAMLTYFQNILIKLKKHMGNYTYIPYQEKIPVVLPIYPRVTYTKLIFNNKVGTKVYLSDDGKKVMKISYQDTSKEVFKGLYGINQLLSYSPNFVRTYGGSKDQVILEYIDGIMLDKYLSSPGFRFDIFLQIIVQLALALHIAQQTIGLVHYDLFPWNIKIKILKKTRDIYYIFGDKIMRIRTRHIPVILDYDKIHIIYQGKHYGGVRKLHMSSVQDIITVLITSLDKVLRQRVKCFRQIITLINFIKNTTYARNTYFRCISQVKNFITTAKKYDNIIFSDKGVLEGKTPIDLIKYINYYFKPTFMAVSKTYLFLDEATPRPKVGLDAIKHIKLSTSIYGYYMIEKLKRWYKEEELRKIFSGLEMKGLDYKVGKISQDINLEEYDTYNHEVMENLSWNMKLPFSDCYPNERIQIIQALHLSSLPDQEIKFYRHHYSKLINIDMFRYLKHVANVDI